MPQLVKDGKNVFGWSKVGNSGCIKIPMDVIEEYNLRPSNKVLIMSGSKTSRGFSIVKIEKLINSPLSIVLDNNPNVIWSKI